jgi:hypothetical protein
MNRNAMQHIRDIIRERKRPVYDRNNKERILREVENCKRRIDCEK